MDFQIKNIQKNIAIISREIGYKIIDTREGPEYNLVRKLGVDNFPRLHIYVKENGRDFSFSLHLDQKAPSYEGSHAHSGEYFGPIVEDEADRIKETIIASSQ